MGIIEDGKFISNFILLGDFLFPMFFVLLISAMLIKRAGIEVEFLSAPIAVLVFVFLNPFSLNYLSNHGLIERIIRLLWVFPITIVISFFAVKIVFQMKRNITKVFLATIVVGVLLFMTLSSLNENCFIRGENAYKIPNDIITICDAIEKDGNQGKLMPAIEGIEFYRQYNPGIIQIYGKDLLHDDEVYQQMAGGKYDVSWIKSYAKQSGARYLTLFKDTPVTEAFHNYEIQLLCETDKLLLFKIY